MTEKCESSDDDKDPGEAAVEAPAIAEATPDRHKPDRIYECVREVLYWVRHRRIAQWAPDRFLTPIDWLIHVNAQFHSHRRAKAGFRWTDEDQFSVSPSDHVGIPSLFIVELFPPSVKANFDRAKRRNRWDTKQLRMYGDHLPTLDEARSGDHWTWWPLGEVVRRGSGVTVGDASHRKMPKEFDCVELKALQIGQGITAIMAKFDLNEAAVSRLDESWHREYQPEISWDNRGGRWPRARGKEFAAFRRVQEERGRLHSVARQWFSAKWPGFFAANDQPQPLLDVVLFDEITAYPEKRPSPGVAGAIRALGLPHPYFVQRSTAFPAMILGQMDIRSDSDIEDRCTWALWGNRTEVLNDLSNLIDSYGPGRQDGSIAHYIRDAVENYFLRLSISEMLEVCQARYSAIRDGARQHGQLNRLRSSLLTLSIDLSSVDRDIRWYNAQGWQEDHAQFFHEDSPFIVAERDEHGHSLSSEPINMNERVLTDQMQMLEALRAADSDYRGILTAAASLTASLQSIRTAKAAIWLAISSLGVAIATLFVTDISSNNLLEALSEWIELLSR